MMLLLLLFFCCCFYFYYIVVVALFYCCCCCCCCISDLFYCWCSCCCCCCCFIVVFLRIIFVRSRLSIFERRKIWLDPYNNDAFLQNQYWIGKARQLILHGNSDIYLSQKNWIPFQHRRRANTSISFIFREGYIADKSWGLENRNWLSRSKIEAKNVFLYLLYRVLEYQDRKLRQPTI